LKLKLFNHTGIAGGYLFLNRFAHSEPTLKQQAEEGAARLPPLPGFSAINGEDGSYKDELFFSVLFIPI